MSKINRKSSEALHGLTIFRFVAALYIFLFHCHIRFRLDIPDSFQSILKNGAVGMSFFFVLSGFVLAWSSRGGIKENYFKHRIARIYPAYLLMGVLTLPLLLNFDIYKFLSVIILFLTGMQAWYPQSFPIWHFSGSWSISVELFFYLCFPFILPYVRKKPVTWLVFAFVSSSLVIPIAIALDGKHMMPNYYMSPLHRLPEFILGISLGVIYSNGFRLLKSKLLLSIISIIVLASIATWNNYSYLYNNYLSLPCIAVLILALASTEIKRNIITNILIYLGEISYSFYLMQLPLNLYVNFYRHDLGVIPNHLIWIALGIINIILAALCFEIIEKNNRIKNFLLR